MVDQQSTKAPIYTRHNKDPPTKRIRHVSTNKKGITLLYPQKGRKKDKTFHTFRNFEYILKEDSGFYKGLMFVFLIARCVQNMPS